MKKKKLKQQNKRLVKVLKKIYALEINSCNSGYLAINWAGLALEEEKEIK